MEDGKGKNYCYVTSCSVSYIPTLGEQTVVPFGIEQSALGSADSSEVVVNNS